MKRKIKDCNCQACRRMATTNRLMNALSRIVAGIKGLVFKQPDAHKA